MPAGTAAAVYLQASPAAPFALLGALAAAKPSAIFRTSIGGSKAPEDADAMIDGPVAGPAAGAPDMTIGISLEPIEHVERALAELRATRAAASSGMEVARVGTAPTTKVLAQRIIGNAFNFLASFGSDVVPLKAFEEWWKKFERKVEADPTFLEREVGA
jgi:hypothetical protein